MTCHQSHNLKKKKKRLTASHLLHIKSKKHSGSGVGLPLAHAHELFGVSP
jgi:hypothetical protein